MRFVTVRDLRGRSADIWRQLAEERELVVTSNGKPVGVLSAVSEETLEESLAAIRRARAESAVAAMQTQSVKTGRDKMPLKEVNAEVAAVRSRRRR